MSSRSTLFSATCVHCSSVRGPKSAHSWRMWRGLRHRASDRAGLHALRDNDLMCAVHGNLGVVACDHSAGSGRLDTAVGIGEIALGAIRRPAVRSALRPAGPLHHARGGARSSRHRAAAPWLLPPRPPWRRGCVRGGRSCWRPSRASRRRAARRRVRDRPRRPSPRPGKPGRHLGGKPLLRLAHAPIGHRLVHAGIGLNLGAVERHMSELHAIERRSRLT